MRAAAGGDGDGKAGVVACPWAYPVRLQPLPNIRQLQQRAAAAAAAGCSDSIISSSAVPLRAIVGDETGGAQDGRAQPTTARSLYAAFQTGQCTLECDMSQGTSSSGMDSGLRSDLLPQPLTLVRRHHRDKMLHYGQIKMALSRDQVLEGAAIRDLADGARTAVADRTSNSLQKLGALRGSLPNMSVETESAMQLQLPAAPPRNHHHHLRHHHHQQLRGPLLVSGIFNTSEDTPIVATRGRGGGDGSRTTAAAVVDTTLQQTNDVATAQPTAQLSWQQVLGPQRIPTVTKPPTIAAPHPSAQAGGVSLPQRGRHHSRTGGGGGGASGGLRTNGSGSAGSAGAAATIRAAPEEPGRQDAEPRYVDPFIGAPASMQTRLAEIAVLEAETVRWERGGGGGGGKTRKKNGRDRDD